MSKEPKKPDLSALERAETAVDILQFSLDSAFDSVFWVLPDSRFAYVNEAACRSLGYTKQELLQMGVFDVAGALPYKTFDDFWRRLKEERHFSFESTQKRKDGSTFPVEVSVNYLKLGDQEWNCVFVRDLTHAKATEESLETVRAHFQTLIRNSPIAVLLLDQNLRVEYCNPAFERIFQYSLKGIRGKDVDHLLAAPDFLDEARALSQTITEGQPVRIVSTRMRKDGRPVSVEISANPIQRNGEVIGVYVLYNDISDRLVTEAALKASEERYAYLFNHIGDPIFLFDAETFHFVDCNQTALRVYGYSRQELLKMTPSDLHRAADREFVERSLEEGHPLEPRAYVHVTKEGKEIDAEIISDRIDLAGRPAWISLVRDVSDRRAIEQKLRQREAELLQAQKMEALGQLAGGIAHDFNNLLAAIIGYGQLLQERLQREGGPSDELEEILSAADQAAGLTEQLLTFGRKQILKPHSTDLNALLSDFRGLLEGLLPDDIQLQMNLCRSKLLVRAVPNQLQQVVMNLAVNARDAMPDGGNLKLSTQVEELGSRERSGLNLESGQYALLRVADNGVGIDPRVTSRIFEPFFTTKEMGRGTGLGLSTVYGIIKQYKGDIRVRSKPGQGTEFEIYLPLEPTADSEAAPGEKTVLLVEDRKEVLELCQRILRHRGFHVLVAQSGSEALQRLEQFEGEINVLVTDVVMPEMSGTDLARTAVEKHPDLKVIFMSGYTENSLVEEAISGSLKSEFLQKPFRPADLVGAVTSALRTGS